MNPFVVQFGDITADDLALLKHVRQIVRSLRDDLDCHQVCATIVQEIPKLRHIRGGFTLKAWQHSWLVIPGRDVLIDPYPWCCGSGPILIYTGGTLNPWRDLYIPATVATGGHP